MNKEAFEKSCIAAGFRPCERVHTPYGDILIADGYFTNKPHEYAFGYYKTVAVIDRSGLDWGYDFECDAFHDPGLLPDQKRQARVNKMVQECIGWMSVNIESARYDK